MWFGLAGEPAAGAGRGKGLVVCIKGTMLAYPYPSG